MSQGAVVIGRKDYYEILKCLVRQVTGQNDLSGVWVGLGSTNIIQAGLDMKQMRVWYELLPAAPVYLFSVNQNDDIHISIGLNQETGRYLIVILDETQWIVRGAEFNYYPENTAEWILETPFKPGGGQYNIGHFGTVTVDSAQWRGPALQYRRIYNSGTVYRDRMITLNYELLTPSHLGGDGSSFSFTRN